MTDPIEAFKTYRVEEMACVRQKVANREVACPRIRFQGSWTAGSLLFRTNPCCLLLIPSSRRKKVWQSLNHVWLFATSWTVACQAPLSKEYWSGWPFPSPGDLPHTGMEPWSPALQVNPLPSEPPEKPKPFNHFTKKWKAKISVQVGDLKGLELFPWECWNYSYQWDNFLWKKKP